MFCCVSFSPGSLHMPSGRKTTPGAASSEATSVLPDLWHLAEQSFLYTKIHQVLNRQMSNLWITCGLPVDYLCITCSKHCKTNSKSNPLTFVSIYPRSFLKCSIKCQMFEKFEETQANLQQLHSDSIDPHRGTTMFGSCKSHAISKQDIS